MAPPVSFAKATLSYPVYAADFDPYNRGYLVVGGGGGEGRSGVSNKITLLDTATRSSLDVVEEIELSRDEDSVTSLTNLASKDGLITLTGINSSEADQKSGKNEHLRAFDVRYPKRRKTTLAEKESDEKSAAGGISLLGKSSLFKPAQGPKPEQYQRVLRLSPAQRTQSGSKRIGAVATGLAKRSQLVVFDATKTPVQQSDIITAQELEDEAADVDIANLGSDFSIAWCSDYSIYEQTVSYDFGTKKKELTPKGPRNVHTISKQDAAGKTKIRQKHRSIRFLTDHHVLVLSNLPNKSGAELSILHLYPTGPAAVLFHKYLPSHIKQAVGMDVCALDADEVGNRQIVIAVAGQDVSIEIYTLNYSRQSDTFSLFKSFTTFRDVHPLQMTAIRFAPFFAPETAKDGKTAPKTKDQVIQLASVSMGNTVVVDTFDIQPLDSSKPGSRYVLSHPTTEKFTQTVTVALISLIVLVTAMLAQSILFPEQSKNLTSFVVGPVRSFLERSNVGNIPIPGGTETEHDPLAAARRLRDILHLHHSEASSGGPQKKAVVLRSLTGESTALDVEVIPDREEYLKKDAEAKHWDQLEDHEKDSWREALIRAGEWTVDEGESVLKGILFSSYAGLVGQVAGEAIRGM